MQAQLEQDMPDELAIVIGKPTGPSPTIGQISKRLQPMPIRRRVDFYDTIGRLHGLIVLLPMFYGALQLYRGQTLTAWFWWMALATLAFALLARRAPFLRLSAVGISFPERGLTEYPWEKMSEARARADELDIVLADGGHITISYKRMRGRDIELVKQLIREQFQAMGERARAMAQ